MSEAETVVTLGEPIATWAVVAAAKVIGAQRELIVQEMTRALLAGDEPAVIREAERFCNTPLRKTQEAPAPK
jgi:hypothetical protein